MSKTTYEELFQLPGKLVAAADVVSAPELSDPLDRLERAATRVGESFSGSWLGYHSRVYYEDFKLPPPGDHFSQEWGLMNLYSDSGSTDDWKEYPAQVVLDEIESSAGNPDLDGTEKAVSVAAETFRSAKADALSLLQVILTDRPDGFLEGIKGKLERMELLSGSDILEMLTPRGEMVSRDMMAVSQRMQAPPHMKVIARVRSLRHTIKLCRTAADEIAKAASHIERLGKQKITDGRVGTNVFIGHGRSFVWRDLKDFVKDRLGLPYDEFNRIPVAGVTNITRVSEMLDAAAVAFVVMTAEDEKADGEMQARMNVIHEVGLFQGRLGFTKAIVLLEEGCVEFSNIQGLGQIRFPKGNITAKFEEIRLLLEREGVITG